MNFRSQETLIDFDSAIINLECITNAYNTIITDRGVLKNEILIDIHRDITRRDGQIKSLLELGRCIFVYLPAPITCFDLNKHFIDLLDHFEFTKLKTVGATGKNIEFKGEVVFSPLWSANKQNLEYRAYFQKPIGKSFLYIKDTQYVVGTHIKVNKGHVIFLPYLKAHATTQPFFDSILALIDDLKQEDTGKVIMPLWSKDYHLPNEDSQRGNLVKLEEDLSIIQQKIDQKKYEIENIEKQKILFVGTGIPLEIEVKKIFEALGFVAEDTQPGRDDLILKYENRIAVAEIKGVKNSAGEKHAAQLEKWVNEYYTNNDIKPKGILIVNTYNDKPLNERTEPSFPIQMHPYSINREHCLITGIQLLCLYLDCKNNEEKKREIIELLFSTNGVFKAYDNWNMFLSKEVKNTEQ